MFKDRRILKTPFAIVATVAAAGIYTGNSSTGENIPGRPRQSESGEERHIDNESDNDDPKDQRTLHYDRAHPKNSYIID